MERRKGIATVDQEDWTPMQFAKKLGVSRATISNWMEAKIIDSYVLPNISNNPQRTRRRIPFGELARIKSKR